MIGKTGLHARRPAGASSAQRRTDGREIVIALLGSTRPLGRRPAALRPRLRRADPSDRSCRWRRRRRRRGAARAQTSHRGRRRDDRRAVPAGQRPPREPSTARARGRCACRASARRVDRLSRCVSARTRARHEAESARNRLAKRGYRAGVVGQALMLGECPAARRRGPRREGPHAEAGYRAGAARGQRARRRRRRRERSGAPHARWWRAIASSSSRSTTAANDRTGSPPRASGTC